MDLTLDSIQNKENFYKKECLENNIVGSLIRKGLFTELREVARFGIIDNLLLYKYKYETAAFYNCIDFKTIDNYFKMSMKTINYRFDFVSNDLESKHFNDLKTVFTFNTRVFRFVKVSQRFRPLQAFGYIFKRMEGFYPKLKEFFNLTGSNVNYKIVHIMNNVEEKTSTFANIFIYFSYVKSYVLKTLRKVDPKKSKALFSIFFTARTRSKQYLRIIASGFTFKVRNPKRKFFIKYDPKAKYKIFKILRTLAQIIQKRRRTYRRIIYRIRSLYKKAKFILRRKFKRKKQKKLITFKSVGVINKLKYNHIIKRTMMTTVLSLAAKQSAARTLGVSMQQRSYASAHGGKFTVISKQNTQGNLTASNDNVTAIASDTTGVHSVGVITSCSNAECKNNNCATGSSETNPCGVSGEFHQKTIFEMKNAEQYGIVHELNGNLTHKIPKNASGVILDTKDINGTNTSQYILHEPGVIPVDPTTFKESEKITMYLQQDKITHAMIENASKDSILNINNKEPSTLLKKSQVNPDEII